MTKGEFSAQLEECRYCPRCGADWQGAEIPTESRYAYGGATHGSKLIGRVWNDRVQEWSCPDCGQGWNRFTGEPLPWKDPA
jgi:rubredoxin